MSGRLESKWLSWARVEDTDKFSVSRAALSAGILEGKWTCAFHRRGAPRGLFACEARPLREGASAARGQLEALASISGDSNLQLRKGTRTVA